MEPRVESVNGSAVVESGKGQSSSNQNRHMEMVNSLTPAQREWYEERAATLEFCAMLCRAEAERVALRDALTLGQ